MNEYCEINLKSILEWTPGMWDWKGNLGCVHCIRDKWDIRPLRIEKINNLNFHGIRLTTHNIDQALVKLKLIFVVLLVTFYELFKQFNTWCKFEKLYNTLIFMFFLVFYVDNLARGEHEFKFEDSWWVYL